MTQVEYTKGKDHSVETDSANWNCQIGIANTCFLKKKCKKNSIENENDQHLAPNLTSKRREHVPDPKDSARTELAGRQLHKIQRLTDYHQYN